MSLVSSTQLSSYASTISLLSSGTSSCNLLSSGTSSRYHRDERVDLTYPGCNALIWLKVIPMPSRTFHFVICVPDLLFSYLFMMSVIASMDNYNNLCGVALSQSVALMVFSGIHRSMLYHCKHII